MPRRSQRLNQKLTCDPRDASVLLASSPYFPPDNFKQDSPVEKSDALVAPVKRSRKCSSSQKTSNRNPTVHRKYVQSRVLRTDETASQSEQSKSSSEEWQPVESQSEASSDEFIHMQSHSTARKSRTLNQASAPPTVPQKTRCPRISKQAKKIHQGATTKPSPKLQESFQSGAFEHMPYFDKGLCDSSSEEFASEKLGEADRFKGRKAGKLLLFSQFQTGVRKTKASTKASTKQKPHPDELLHDSEEDDDWEEVGEKSVREVDFMQTLLSSKSEVPDVTLPDREPTMLTVSVPTLVHSKKVTTKDPAQAERQARLRRVKELAYSMHLTHVLCFLTHARWLNRLCDSELYRALGLSLLDRVDSVFDSSGCFLSPALWDLDAIRACIVSILTRHCTVHDSTEQPSSRSATLVKRISVGCATPKDCLILLVSALRALDFDVRVVVSLTPIALKPALETSYTPQPKPEVLERTVRNPEKAGKTKNRKIISSSSSDERDVESTARYTSKSRFEVANPGIHTFAEVFLARENRWVCFEMTPPVGRLDAPQAVSSGLYTVGLTTCFSSSTNTKPYVNRTPVDLASRYDPSWCDESRFHRLPADKWSKFLNYMQMFFNSDAVSSGGDLVSRENDLVTVRRDIEDENSIRTVLLSKPLPARVQDFKNHPLYALQRHLLKFEVIHPPDAIPLGFFRNEPVYSRDCVHLCHTRESWLKEAKVVRMHEKPAKTVKARMSMKRKLLQGSDPTPPTVDIYGPWQVEDYQPPVAQNGVVPRNEHGTIDLFKPSMLPIGCAHICLTGIQYIAKKLGIDCAPAVIGWTFHGAGWAVPQVHGYVVCKENVPALIDAWRATRMNAAKAAAEERSARALENWKKLVRGLFLWHRIKAQFALAALHDKPASESKASTSGRKRKSRKSEGKLKDTLVPKPVPDASALGSIELGSITSQVGSASGWQRLGMSSEVQPLPSMLANKEPPKEKRSRPVTTKRRPQQRRTNCKKRKFKVESSTSEDSDVPSSNTDTEEEQASDGKDSASFNDEVD